MRVCVDARQDDVGSKPDAAAQGRGGVKGLGKKGNQHAARLAAEARQALAVRVKSRKKKSRVAFVCFPCSRMFQEKERRVCWKR